MNNGVYALPGFMAPAAKNWKSQLLTNEDGSVKLCVYVGKPGTQVYYSLGIPGWNWGFIKDAKYFIDKGYPEDVIKEVSKFADYLEEEVTELPEGTVIPDIIINGWPLPITESPIEDKVYWILNIPKFILPAGDTEVQISANGKLLKYTITRPDFSIHHNDPGYTIPVGTGGNTLLADMIAEHANDTSLHITDEEREGWNERLVSLEGSIESVAGDLASLPLRYGSDVVVASDECGYRAIALGNNNKATGNSSTAIGNNNKATEQISTTLGCNNDAAGQRSTAIGDGNNSTGKYSTTLGYSNDATGQRSTAIGYNNAATNANSTALGAENSVTGEDSVALGRGNEAIGYISTTLGYYNTATEEQSTALGAKNTASEYRCTALGNNNTATGYQSTALGSGNFASSASIALGLYNTANGGQSAALGVYNVATGLSSTALGNYSRAYAYQSTALGSYNDVYGDYSIATGTGNLVHGDAAVAVGTGNSAAEENSLAVGVGNYAGGYNSISIGCTAYSDNMYSMAIGYDAYAGFSSSAALGIAAVADKEGSLVISATNIKKGTRVSLELVAGTATGGEGDMFSDDKFVTDTDVKLTVRDMLTGKEHSVSVSLSKLMQHLVQDLQGVSEFGTGSDGSYGYYYY